jgi:hypothetical protein
VAFSTRGRRIPSVRHRSALENDVQQGDEVHDDEHSGHGIQAVYVRFSPRGDTDEHEGDAKFDGDNCGAVEDFKEEEVLGMLVLIDGSVKECIPASLELFHLKRVCDRELQRR